MKQSGKCPKCESTEIIADAKAVDRSEGHWRREFTVATFQNPEAFVFKGEQTSTVSAWVCGRCGFVELYADEPNTLNVNQQPSE